MKNHLTYAFRVSRFRFWIYTAGTYVVGFSLGAPGLEAYFRPEYIVFLLYFFFPANLFIYGSNDLWDEKTDRENPKKGSKEEKLTPQKRTTLSRMVKLTAGLSMLLLIFLDDVSRLVFITFLFLSYFYSAKPLRFKSIPFLDFSSNMLYIMPGILGFYLASGILPGILLVIAGYLHISAMHLFSAIPDIKYDTQAGIRTTATILKRKASLFICLLFWSGLAYIVLSLTDFHPLSFFILAYPLVPLSLLLRKSLGIERVYWVLPYINTSLGGLLTLWLVLGML